MTYLINEWTGGNLSECVLHFRTENEHIFFMKCLKFLRNFKLHNENYEVLEIPATNCIVFSFCKSKYDFTIEKWKHREFASPKIDRNDLKSQMNSVMKLNK